MLPDMGFCNSSTTATGGEEGEDSTTGTASAVGTSVAAAVGVIFFAATAAYDLIGCDLLSVGMCLAGSATCVGVSAGGSGTEANDPVGDGSATG